MGFIFVVFVSVLVMQLCPSIMACSRTVTEPCQDITSAVAQFTAEINGHVVFSKSGDKVLIKGEIKGLTPGKHGFHIHTYGDFASGCSTASGHYNPYSKDHASQSSADRHVGDLGNILANDQGTATINLEDSFVKLSGKTSVVGRAVVVHAGADDLGLGGDAESKKTGNAGSRVACAIIGIKNPS